MQNTKPIAGVYYFFEEHDGDKRYFDENILRSCDLIKRTLRDSRAPFLHRGATYNQYLNLLERR